MNSLDLVFQLFILFFGFFVMFQFVLSDVFQAFSEKI